MIKMFLDPNPDWRTMVLRYKSFVAFNTSEADKRRETRNNRSQGNQDQDEASKALLREWSEEGVKVNFNYS